MRLFFVALVISFVIPLPLFAAGAGTCDPGTGRDDGIQTAIGCIDVTSTAKFTGSLQNFALGIGGGLAFLLILVGAIQILTSSGNPEKVKAGSELLTSAISGLLFIIFAVFILRIITAEILHLPGFFSR